MSAPRGLPSTSRQSQPSASWGPSLVGGVCVTTCVHSLAVQGRQAGL